MASCLDFLSAPHGLWAAGVQVAGVGGSVGEACFPVPPAVCVPSRSLFCAWELLMKSAVPWRGKLWYRDGQTATC